MSRKKTKRKVPERAKGFRLRRFQKTRKTLKRELSGTVGPGFSSFKETLILPLVTASCTWPRYLSNLALENRVRAQSAARLIP